MKSTIHTPDFGKIPPQAIDIEEALLGSLLIDGDAYYRIDMKPEMFYKEYNQKIFASIQTLVKLNNPIDILTVTEQLRKEEVLDEIGGPYYITQLTTRIALSNNVEYYSKIVIEQYLKREIIRFSTEAASECYDEGNDVYDIFNNLFSKLDLLNNLHENDDPKPWNILIKESLNNAEKRYKMHREGKLIGIPTPIYKLNKWTCGWQPKQLIIIAGRPGMGKTAWAIGCMKTAALHGYNPVLFSLEMSDTSISDRIIIGECGIDADDYRRGSINEYDWMKLTNEIGKITDYKILIDDKPRNIDRIRSKARSLRRKGKCDLLIIDYIQLVGDNSIKSNANREQEVSNISRKLKLLAMELNIPVIALSQLNRKVEERASKKPMLSDLRESGSLEQDADLIMFPWRPEVYGIIEDEDGNSLNGQSFVIIEKQREGRIGTIPFKYNDSITSIYDYEE